MDKARIINRCDKIILISLYGIAYFLPISKAIIEFLSILAIVFFVFKKAVQRKGIPVTYFNFVIFAYLAISFFSIFLSSNVKISSRTFTCKILQDLSLFFVIADALNNESRARTFIYILFVSSLLLGVDGIYQYFTHKDFIRNRPDLAIPRIYASFRTPNDFGCYLITIIPFLIVTFFVKLRTKIFKFAIAGLFLLLFACLMLSVSRGAWLGFVVSVLFLGIWLPSIAAIFIILGLLILVMRSFFHPLIKVRLNILFNFFDPEFIADAGSVERKIIWRAGWRMFLSKPIMGVGLGTFMFNFKKFLAQDYPFGPFYAHNCYLQMAAEIGVIGLFFFLLIILLFYLQGIVNLNNKNIPKTYSWYMLLGSLAALLGYCVHMAVDTSFYSLDLGILFWILLGLGVAAMNSIQKTKEIRCGQDDIKGY